MGYLVKKRAYGTLLIVMCRGCVYNNNTYGNTDVLRVPNFQAKMFRVKYLKIVGFTDCLSSKIFQVLFPKKTLQ